MLVKKLKIIIIIKYSTYIINVLNITKLNKYALNSVNKFYTNIQSQVPSFEP